MHKSSSNPRPRRGRSRPAGPVRSLRLLRIVAALAVFLVLTAALADFRELVPVRVGHWLGAVQFVPALMAAVAGLGISAVILGAIVVITLLFGRLYCSVLCPLGVFQDMVARLGRRSARLLRFARPQRLLRNAVLGAAVAAVVAGWGGFALAVVDPYSNYGRVVSGLFRPVASWINNAFTGLANRAGWMGLYRVELPLHGLGALVIPALLLTAVVVLAVLRGRLYCNAICPVGTVLGLLSRRAAFRISIDGDACTKCGSCLRSCKAQCIDLRAGTVDFDRCVACFNCLDACDERGIGYRFAWRRTRASGEAMKDPQRDVPEPAPAGESRRAFFGRLSALAAAGAWVASRARAATVVPPRIGPAGLIPPRGATPESDGVAGIRDIDPARQHAISPPGSHSVHRFLDRCTACHLCVSACPKHVLQPAVFEYGFEGLMKPRMDYTASFCDYDCTKCVDVCPDGALERIPVAAKQLDQLGLAYFDPDKCIVTTKGTDCAACSEHCPTKAVYTTPYGNNLRLPTVNRDLCIGCGACEYACPVQPVKAIEVSGLRTHGRASRDASKEPSPPKPPSEGDFPF